MADLVLNRSVTLRKRLEAHRSATWQHALFGGLVSAALMILVLGVATAITGDGFFRPLELIGSLWYGSVTTGAAAALIGLATHLGVALILSALWANVFPYVRLEPLATGLVFGAALWVIMQYVVVPIVGGFILGESKVFESLYLDGQVYKVFYLGEGNGFQAWMTLAAYLVFGLGLGGFEQWADRRRASHRSGPEVSATMP